MLHSVIHYATAGYNSHSNEQFCMHSYSNCQCDTCEAWLEFLEKWDWVFCCHASQKQQTAVQACSRQRSQSLELIKVHSFSPRVLYKAR